MNIFKLNYKKNKGPLFHKKSINVESNNKLNLWIIQPGFITFENSLKIKKKYDLR